MAGSMGGKESTRTKPLTAMRAERIGRFFNVMLISLWKSELSFRGIGPDEKERKKGNTKRWNFAYTP